MQRNNPRRGLTMLELLVATTMMTAVLTTVSVVMRTSRVAWEAHEADFTRMEAAYATVRHIVRATRQAESVSSVTSGENPAGSLALLMPTGETLVWTRNAANNTVLFGANTANNELATEITSLTFQGYQADGVTPTNVASEIQSLLVAASVVLPRDVNSVRTVRCWVTKRAW